MIQFDGYATVEPSGPGFEWVCRQCFEDFADELDFVVVGHSTRGRTADPLARLDLRIFIRSSRRFASAGRAARIARDASHSLAAGDRTN
jgi:hypothetical protein